MLSNININRPATMEVCCYVIDFDTAKQVIEQNLKDTEFSNYTRIFDENEE